MPASRPLGQPTRGKTAPNRLRKTDTFLAVAFPEFVRRMASLYVDLGYGFFPITSVETLHRLRRLNPSLRVLGVEIDPQRVAAAQPFAEPGLEFRHGGFNLPVLSGERVGVIRAFNVLRQYDESAVDAALGELSQILIPGGLILEGTSDPLGRLLTFNLFQQQPAGLARIALVLAPTLSLAFQPRSFQAVLPKNFIHHAEPGGLIDRFFAAWHAAWQSARGLSTDPRAIFALSARRLSEQAGYNLDQRPALLRRGFLMLGTDWPHTR
ncbi:MAG: class I SAM-dependent methyltransferase [Anaerolineales bacterium]